MLSDNLPDDRPFMRRVPKGGQLDPRSLSQFSHEAFPRGGQLMLKLVLCYL